MFKIIRQVVYASALVFALYIIVKGEIYFSKYWPLSIRICTVNLSTPDSIISQSDTALIPVNYNGLIDFRAVNPDNRKDLFIGYILPAIVITRERLMDELHHVEFIEERINQKKTISKSDSSFLADIKLRYEADSLDLSLIHISEPTRPY